MKIVINCQDIEDAIRKLENVQSDMLDDEDLFVGKSGDIFYTDFGSIEVD